MVKVSKTVETCDAPLMASARIFAVIAVSAVIFGFCAVSSVAAPVKIMRQPVGQCIFRLLSHFAQTGGFATKRAASPIFSPAWKIRDWNAGDLLRRRHMG